MIEITVDFNNDRVKIENSIENIVSLPAKYPSQILNILEEIFNRLDIVNVKLVKEDEDTRRTIGEW